MSGPLSRRPPLARTGLDRAALRRADPQWLAAAWQRCRVLVIDPAGRVLVEPPSPTVGPGDSGESTAAEAPPRLVLVDPAAAPAGERLFLGVDRDDTPYFAVVAELPSGSAARPVTLREVGAHLSDLDAELLTTAAALANWHAAYRHSPITGEPTVVSAGGWIRLEPGGRQFFPRTDPAVIVLIHDGVAGPAGRCLLGHNAAWRRRDGGRRFFSTLAGFVEPGESAEAAVLREVREEVGVEVSQLRYEGSQSWPFPGSLMLGFTGYADPSQPVRPDLTEIAEARWFTRTEVASLLSRHADPSGAPYGRVPTGSEIALPGPASIAQFLIRTWLDRHH